MCTKMRALEPVCWASIYTIPVGFRFSHVFAVNQKELRFHAVANNFQHKVHVCKERMNVTHFLIAFRFLLNFFFKFMPMKHFIFLFNSFVASINHIMRSYACNMLLVVGSLPFA